MDKETVQKVFDPFFSTKFTGRGLGMSAVLGIVRGHGGAVKVYTEAGRGTTFKVLLPAAEEQAESLPLKKAPAPRFEGGGTVLLVDDEDTVLAVGGRMLQRMGFDVRTAADGREALAVVREDPDAIRCVILDLTMPHMDGEEAFREIRRIRPDLPVVLSSGYNEQDVVGRFAGKSLAGFLQKPYKSAELAAKLSEVLEPQAEAAGEGG